jgi:hypothetical protein
MRLRFSAREKKEEALNLSDFEKSYLLMIASEYPDLWLELEGVINEINNEV